MKKLLPVVALCFCWVLTQAQISKPVAGDLLMELRASGLSNLGLGVNQQYGGVMLRHFKSDMRAHRYAANLSLNVNETDDFTVQELSLNWGMENHMKGSARMSTYWGYDVGLAFLSNFDEIQLQGGLFTGFDFYIADGLYLGAELGYRLGIIFDPFEIDMPGAGMNGSLRLGYRF
jgi:hypothetical protein